jgi:5-(hydroxymethyl)furfural/furfural oxidase
MARAIEADWVVVGGGSGGSVMAGRLSEDPATQVVLLEAGRDWRANEAPSELRSMNGWRALDETACAEFVWLGLESRRTTVQEPRPHLRGRGLGGSSSVNGMIAIRAIPDDYDRWASFGCPEWSYDAMLPYLRRMESDANFGDQPYHGADGPIPVQRLARDQWGPADNALADSALAAGYSWCEDHNAPTGTGVSPYGINARDGARVTTNDGYLEPARGRVNLRVIGDAAVDQVMIENGRAVGVRARIGADIVDVRAEHVVLSAGAIHSPAILLRSGIGPEGTVARLPVGEGMQEHPLALFWLFARPEAQPALDARQTNCCLRYSSELASAGVNDMMIVAVNQTLALPEWTATSAEDADAATGMWGGVAGGNAAGGPGLLCIWVNQQFGRGTLRLASPDPDVHPQIDQNLLKRQGRPGPDARRHSPGARPAALRRVRRVVRACRDRRDRQRPRRAERRRRDRRLAHGDSGRHRPHLRDLPDGFAGRPAHGRRLARPRARCRGALRRRRVGVPGGAASEHEPADDRGG